MLNTHSYGIVIDAGSSGSRLQVYRWSVHDTPTDSPPEIVHDSEWQLKISPGVSSYKETPKSVWNNHFKELAEFAERIVPASAHHKTPVFVLATAGMRLLKPEEQKALLAETCAAWRKHTKFLMNDEFVQIIDGSTEGIYGWLGLNYLKGSFSNRHSENNDSPGSSVGFMDMGGASTQLAFVPSQQDIEKHHDDLSTVVLRNTNGNVQRWDVFVETWLGFGANMARSRYLSSLVSISTSVTDSRTVTDPCMPKSATLEHEYGGKVYKIAGSGNFDLCQKTIYPLLLKNLPCKDLPCLFNGIHTPTLNFGQDTFVGISEYWYTSQDVFGLGGDYDFARFEAATRDFCQLSWADVLQNSQEGKYSNLNPDKFLKNACFKASWVLSVLHDGFEMPKDSAAFSSAKAIGGSEVSWTLGKILLYASSQVSSENTLAVGIYPSEASGKQFISGAGMAAPAVSHFPYLIFMGFFLLVVAWLKKRQLRKYTAMFTKPMASLAHRFSGPEEIDLESGIGEVASAPSSLPPNLSVLRTRSTMSLGDGIAQNPLASRSFTSFNKPFGVPNRSASAMFYSFSENASRESFKNT